MPSKKAWTLQNLMAWFKSLTEIKNKGGPRTESCRIPNSFSARLEL